MTVYTIFLLVGIAALVLSLLRYFVFQQKEVIIPFLQHFVGALFVFSGFVKAIDPLGTSYKMHEYFEAFAGENIYFLSAAMNEKLRALWEFIGNFSTPMAIIMIAAEMFFGIMLIVGWRPRLTVAVVWFLTLFFTFLTGYTYLSGFGITHKFLAVAGLVMLLYALIAVTKNPRTRSILLVSATALLVVMLGLIKFSSIFFTKEFVESGMKVTDCGCFGDFIKLRPWETFYKDVFLDFLILGLVLGVDRIKHWFVGGILKGIATVAAVASLFLCIYCTFLNEPILDFRPYAIGNNIRELREVKKQPVIEKTFIYHSNKTGQNKSFSEDDVMHGKWDYTEYDSLVERKDVVLDPGIPAKIVNLFIEDDEGQEITDSLLSDPNYSLMVVSWRLSTTHTDAFKELNAIAQQCDKIGVKFYAVVMNDGHVEEFRHKYQTAYPFYHNDETALKTMLRSNPGLMLLKNGVVINKWHYRHLPTFEELNATYFSKR